MVTPELANAGKILRPKLLSIQKLREDLLLANEN